MINIVKIETVKGEIHILVELEEYHKHTNKQIVICQAADVIALLEGKKVKVGKCTQSVRLSNTREKHCTGTYIFEKPAPAYKAPKKPSVKPSPKPVEKTSKKVNKNLTTKE
tara:strand:+ start:341 stop:673 length:333 start_codon:yes stop_codon:yes gene_type:complete